jgi:hypothetical protein
LNVSSLSAGLTSFAVRSLLCSSAFDGVAADDDDEEDDDDDDFDDEDDDFDELLELEAPVDDAETFFLSSPRLRSRNATTAIAATASRPATIQRELLDDAPGVPGGGPGGAPTGGATGGSNGGSGGIDGMDAVGGIDGIAVVGGGCVSIGWVNPA